MENITKNIASLTVPIAIRIERLCQEALGAEPGKVECAVLESLDLVITIERHRSATERFLVRQGKSTLLKEIGASVNHAFRERVMLVLMREFNLAVREVSLLKPMSADKFSLLVLID